MSDDEVDYELLDLLRKSLGISNSSPDDPPDTGVLASAEFIFNNSIDVAIDMTGTKAAGQRIHALMSARHYSTASWSEHELHPSPDGGEATLNFIFTMDLLNFSFWSENCDEDRFGIDYRGKRWTGYNSLVAALQRALDQGLRITTPGYWHREAGYSDAELKSIFQSATHEPIPLLEERISVLREAADVLFSHFDSSVANLLKRADGSAARLVNLLAEYFPCFRDETRFEGRRVKIMKRAQIFVADVWACFEGGSYGAFHDIEKITMFADYRIPQILHTLSALLYSPPLESAIRRHQHLPPSSTWEVELRGCSIYAVELIRREILKLDPDAPINAILIDFFLYDTIKELELEETQDESMDLIPHHRTRSIWY